MQESPNNSGTQTTTKLFLSARTRRDEDLGEKAVSPEAHATVQVEDAALEGFHAHALAHPHKDVQPQGAGIDSTSVVSARMGRLLTFMATAAAACLLVFVGRSFLGSSVEVPVEVAGTSAVETFEQPLIATLGGEDLKCIGPVGVVERYADFQWTGTLAPGESYDLLVFDLSNPQAEAAVVIEDLLEARATLDTAEAQLLTGSIRWEVRVRGANGRLTERSIAGEASLDS